MRHEQMKSISMAIVNGSIVFAPIPQKSNPWKNFEVKCAQLFFIS